MERQRKSNSKQSTMNRSNPEIMSFGFIKETTDPNMER
jgi:hypothetical protein